MWAVLILHSSGVPGLQLSRFQLYSISPLNNTVQTSVTTPDELWVIAASVNFTACFSVHKSFHKKQIHIVTSNTWRHFFQSPVSHIDNKVYSCVASWSPRDKPMWPFTNMGNKMRKLARKKGKCSKEMKKMMTRDVKFKSNVNGFIEEIADRGTLTSFPLNIL